MADTLVSRRLGCEIKQSNIGQQPMFGFYKGIIVLINRKI
jgi:hypothetical protein